MRNSNVNLINLPGYSCFKTNIFENKLVFHIRLKSKYSTCTKCSNKSSTVYEVKNRTIQHSSWDTKTTWLKIFQRRFKCNSCKTRFWERLPGILPYFRRTEQLREQVARAALRGHDNKGVAQDFTLGEATVQRDINRFTFLRNQEKLSNICPEFLGIDEHFFTKKKGYATTFCDLKRSKVFDIRLGRSEKSLDSYLNNLKNKERCKIVCIDLSSSYRAIVRKHFPYAKIVADRFHVIRTVNHHFMELWKLLDPLGKKNRGLLSLFRRNPSKLDASQILNLDQYLYSIPGLKQSYDFRNQINKLLNTKTLNYRRMRPAIKEFHYFIEQLKFSRFAPMITLANTFETWQEEILRMLRFTKNNGITEGYHNKMEVISRRAYGFRNFENYRQRVLLQCA
jgi:transposase